MPNNLVRDTRTFSVSVRQSRFVNFVNLLICILDSSTLSRKRAARPRRSLEPEAPPRVATFVRSVPTGIEFLYRPTYPRWVPVAVLCRGEYSLFIKSDPKTLCLLAEFEIAKSFYLSKY
jgi:hypothetical protein